MWPSSLCADGGVKKKNKRNKKILAEHVDTICRGWGGFTTAIVVITGARCCCQMWWQVLATHCCHHLLDNGGEVLAIDHCWMMVGCGAMLLWCPSLMVVVAVVVIASCQ